MWSNPQETGFASPKYPKNVLVNLEECFCVVIYKKIFHNILL